MKLNGALEPQLGASLKRSSIGAKQYCEKQCEIKSSNIVAFHGVSVLGNSSDSFIIKNNNRNNKRNKDHDNNNKNSNNIIPRTSCSNIKCPCSNRIKNHYNQNNSKGFEETSIWTKAPSQFHLQHQHRKGSPISCKTLGSFKQTTFLETSEESYQAENIMETKSLKGNNKSASKHVTGIIKVYSATNENKNELDFNMPEEEEAKVAGNFKNNYNKRNNNSNNNNVNQSNSNNNIYNNMSINTTTLTLLFGAISMLCSCFNYNLGLWTCWLKAYGIDIVSKSLVRVQHSLQALRIPLTRSNYNYNIENNSNYKKSGSNGKKSNTLSKWFAFSDFNWNTAWMLGLFSALIVLPCRVTCDDSHDFFVMESESTTPEFDYASRGQKKFGDKCENTLECGFPGSICDPKKKSCQCTEDLPVTNHIDKCGKEAAVNESCFFNEQCEMKYFQTECRAGRCACRFEMSPFWDKDGTVECKGRQDKKGNETYIDPAMIMILVGMALMFIIICVVLRLFAKARWNENRTIFNTPNPRLMNVSLLRESKLLHGQERRGSRMSMRGPSRQPSMASLRPHSPNPSLGKTGSRSNSSGNSIKSNRSNSVAPGNVANGQLEYKPATNAAMQHHNMAQHQLHQHPHQHPHHNSETHQQQQATNITTNPVAESVTVEIVEPVAKS